jgi:maltose O-acetyltransferase
VNFGCVVLDCAEVVMGDDVALGPYVPLLARRTRSSPPRASMGPELSKPVRIGSNVWIGAGAIVCPGVTIGENTTIGAGSVVVKDVPAGVLAVGNPCRVVREV